MNIDGMQWKESEQCGEDTLYTLILPTGERITVLNRRTGFDWFDTESGYRDENGRFWLASGNCDVRGNGFSVEQAIDFIKSNANTCVGV